MDVVAYFICWQRLSFASRLYLIEANWADFIGYLSEILFSCTFAVADGPSKRFVMRDWRSEKLLLRCSGLRKTRSARLLPGGSDLHFEFRV